MAVVVFKKSKCKLFVVCHKLKNNKKISVKVTSRVEKYGMKCLYFIYTQNTMFHS